VDITQQDSIYTILIL